MTWVNLKHPTHCFICRSTLETGFKAYRIRDGYLCMMHGLRQEATRTLAEQTQVDAAAHAHQTKERT